MQTAVVLGFLLLSRCLCVLCVTSLFLFRFCFIFACTCMDFIPINKQVIFASANTHLYLYINEVFLFSSINKYVIKGDVHVPQFALPSYDPEERQDIDAEELQAEHIGQSFPNFINSSSTSPKQRTLHEVNKSAFLVSFKKNATAYPKTSNTPKT